MNYPKKIDGKEIITISKKGHYGKMDNEEICYIAIVYNKYVLSYIYYDLNNEFKVLSSLVWEGDTFEDCKQGLQATYSAIIEWENAIE